MMYIKSCYSILFLVFTNSVRHAHLERIAEADEQEVIKDFQVNLENSNYI